MLFYVAGGPKEGQPMPPPEQLIGIVVKEWETVLDFQKQGKIVGAFGLVEKPGGFVICDVDSKEDLDDLLKQLPMHPYVTFNIMPLITAEEALARAKQGKVEGPPPTG
jgi:muconolactone delta-isomerase